MADYEQPVAATRRVRFFDGQFLVEQDFVDEQKYHIDRERRLGKVLKVTGVVDGLLVSSPEANKVLVRAGTAIDRDGRQLVLAEDRTVDLAPAAFNDQQGVRLVIVYRETAVDMATEGGSSERRWLEDPLVVAVDAKGGTSSTETWDTELPVVLLALLRLDNQGRVTVDATAAELAGMVVPGALGVGANALADHKLSVNGRTRLGGIADYKANAVLSVAPGSVYFDAPNIVGGRLAIDGTNGNVGVGVPAPKARLDVGGAADNTAQLSLLLRSGNSAGNYSSTQLSLAYNGGNQYRHAVKTRHNGSARTGNALDFYVWKHGDSPDTPAGQHTMTLDGGNVGIGTITPRTALDTGKGVLSGAINDYMKAQFTMSGGGTVTWGGPGQRLKWTYRFIAISMERGNTFSEGHVSINMPTSDIPGGNVYDGKPRAASSTEGVLLREWEALYAVHNVGGKSTDLAGFQICHWQTNFQAPSNWILVAVVNQDDGSLKLGTGTTLAARSSHTNGNHLPVGMIMMWSGAATAIPYGWQLCDGSNGTPDLRGRFIVGVDQQGATRYNPGNAGEPDAHSHTTTIGANTMATVVAGDHNHRFPDAWRKEDLYSQTVVGARGAIDPYGAPPQNNTTKNAGAHAHSLPPNNIDLASTASGGLNRPRWYALCFIMKL